MPRRLIGNQSEIRLIRKCKPILISLLGEAGVPEAASRPCHGGIRMAASSTNQDGPSTTRSPLTGAEKVHIGVMAAVILSLHLIGWGIFVVAILPQHFKLLGLGVAVTAYTLGMRHAFDADHIAAIDNTTRKLMAENKRPLSVGFFFSLGHSTIVFTLGVGLTFAARAVIGAVSGPHSQLTGFGAVFGTVVSGIFLYLIGILNLVILVGIVRLFFAMRSGRYSDQELERL